MDTATAPPQQSPPVVVRELGPGEDRVHLDVFAGLSARSRYHRYHTGVPRLTAAMTRQLAAVDGARHVALVAEGSDGAAPEAVGLARYLVVGPGVADLAVEVVDAWQGRGVGRLLIGALAAHARARGVERFVGEVVGDNAAALALGRSAFDGFEGRWHRGVLAFSARTGAPTTEVTTRCS
jgi:GNAT superfamily N-acetyltransferase